MSVELRKFWIKSFVLSRVHGRYIDGGMNTRRVREELVLRIIRELKHVRF